MTRKPYCLIGSFPAGHTNRQQEVIPAVSRAKTHEVRQGLVANSGGIKQPATFNSHTVRKKHPGDYVCICMYMLYLYMYVSM